MDETLQQLSHDIRSAMSDVLGGVRLVDTARLDAQTQTQIDRIRAAADNLAVLVDEMLLAAYGDTAIGQAVPRIDCRNWLEALQDRWAGRASERGCAFTVNGREGMPDLLDISPVVLDRIVGNLISNAILHGAGGEVRLDISRTAARDVVMTITDTGSGFPDHVLAEADTPPAVGAKGLGLRIVRALGADIGAEVALSNRLDTGGEGAILGACASVLVPSELSTERDEPVAPASVPDLGGLGILVAEDNLTNQTILRQMLHQMGAEAEFVADGEAALEALRSRPYDLALIDIEMPRLSGLEVMEQVRSDPGDLARLPLVAITAYVMRENREAIYAAGADGIIGKPVASAAEFGRAILRHVGQPFDVQSLDAGADGSGSGQKKMDEALLDALLDAAGHHGSAELLDRVVEDLERCLTALDAAMEAGDLAQVRGQTHILIAVSGAVGAARLCQLAEVLNIAAKRGNPDKLPAIYSPMRRDHVDLISLISARRSALDP